MRPRRRKGRIAAFPIPYPGKWQMTVRVQLGETDEAVLVSPFSVR